LRQYKKAFFVFIKIIFMRKTTGFVILSVTLFCFVACKKDNNNSTSASVLAGTWTFMGMHATTSATAVDSGIGFSSKDITTSDYQTTANGGTMTISGNTMTGTGITYAANIIAFATQYQDDILIDTFSTSIPFSIPATNSSSTFEVIGKDSIHYTGTNIFGSAGSGAPAATGSKFSVSGNIMTLTSVVAKDTVSNIGTGETLTQHELATVVASLQKQ
jgi:hypothetical protein